jgi:Rrf2 family protein
MKQGPTPSSLPDHGKTAASGGVALYGATVEYGVHCLLLLVRPLEKPASSRELAELLGVSPTIVAKIFPKLEKAGLVMSTGGISGGYRMARDAAEISVLDVIDAIEGDRRLFDCKEVRQSCALFGGTPPAWVSGGVCGVHAVMLRAEKSMRAEMARTSILDLAEGMYRKAPAEFGPDVSRWFGDRAMGRERSRITAVKTSTRRRRADD